MNEELKNKLTERFNSAYGEEVKIGLRDALRKVYLDGVEHGYQYAKKKTEDYLLCVELSNFFPTLSDEDADKGKEALIKSIKEFLEEM